MPSESKRLARLIPSDTLEAVSNPSFPNRAYTFQRTSALYGVSLEAHRPHVSVMHLPRSHSGTHTSVLSHLGQASIFGGVSPLPVPGYLSGPSCRGFEPLCQGLVDHHLYLALVRSGMESHATHALQESWRDLVATRGKLKHRYVPG